MQSAASPFTTPAPKPLDKKRPPILAPSSNSSKNADLEFIRSRQAEKEASTGGGTKKNLLNLVDNNSNNALRRTDSITKRSSSPNRQLVDIPNRQMVDIPKRPQSPNRSTSPTRLMMGRSSMLSASSSNMHSSSTQMQGSANNIMSGSFLSRTASGAPGVPRTVPGAPGLVRTGSAVPGLVRSGSGAAPSSPLQRNNSDKSAWSFGPILHGQSNGASEDQPR